MIHNGFPPIRRAAARRLGVAAVIGLIVAAVAAVSVVTFVVAWLVGFVVGLVVMALDAAVDRTVERDVAAAMSRPLDVVVDFPSGQRRLDGTGPASSTIAGAWCQLCRTNPAAAGDELCCACRRIVIVRDDVAQLRAERAAGGRR